VKRLYTIEIDTEHVANWEVYEVRVKDATGACPWSARSPELSIAIKNATSQLPQM
jgi:hypothetical protein